MSCRHALAALLLLAHCLPALAGPELLQAVAGRLEYRQGVAGAFTQSKYLSFMSRPLVSSGHFSLSADAGLRWQVEAPVSSLMTVRDGVVTLDGQPVQDSGVGRLMARIMRGFMHGELEQISEGFSVSGELQPAHWSLALAPRNPLMATVISEIRVRGDTYLQWVEVRETSGNSTTIAFSALHEADREADAGGH